MSALLSRAEMQAEALHRAESGQSWANFGAIFEGFMAKGIAESEILPRVNVFTYHAWRAKGRQVRKGERGIKVTTWVTPRAKSDESTEPKENAKPRRGKIAWSATVFHVSQTDPIA